MIFGGVVLLLAKRFIDHSAIKMNSKDVAYINTGIQNLHSLEKKLADLCTLLIAVVDVGRQLGVDVGLTDINECDELPEIGSKDGVKKIRNMIKNYGQLPQISVNNIDFFDDLISI